MAAYLVRLVTGLEISVSVALMECAGCAVILYLLDETSPPFLKTTFLPLALITFTSVPWGLNLGAVPL